VVIYEFISCMAIEFPVIPLAFFATPTTWIR